MIQIKVNDQVQQFEKAINLEQLVAQLEISSRGIAIAVNATVAKRDHWSETYLQQNDEVLIIKSTQGG